MAYVDSIGIICYSQWVVYADPIDIICSSQRVACAVSFSFLLVLLVLPMGGLCVASGWYTQFLLFLFFPFSTARFGQRLA